MKKSTLIFAILTVCFAPAMGSCGGSDSPDSPTKVVDGNVTVNVSPEVLAADAAAQTINLTVTANADWAIRSDVSWVNLRPSGGVKDQSTTVKVAIDANNEMDSRDAELSIVSGGKTVKTIKLTQNSVSKASLSASGLTFGAQGSSSAVTVTSNTDWSLTADAAWISVSPSKGSKGETPVTVTVEKNETSATREGTVTLTYGDNTTELKISQLSDEIVVPEGYHMVWNDEFNSGERLGSDWTHEVQRSGWVNNELQNYVNGQADGKNVTEIKDGFLNINCFKGSDGKIYSGRVYAKVNQGWTYGYFEARIKLPKGKGTWPAFWMMPVGNDWNTNPWPKCGEIDIMEEVGADPNQVSSSLHTEKYNHTKNTQKTHAMNCPGAEDGFHVYALEWTEDAITTYVDGKVQLRATKAEMGSDHDSWPFHYAFYPILNLAWGGDWGGYKGVDESALPVTMQVDYLRIFQK